LDIACALIYLKKYLFCIYYIYSTRYKTEISILSISACSLHAAARTEFLERKLQKRKKETQQSRTMQGETQAGKPDSELVDNGKNAKKVYCRLCDCCIMLAGKASLIEKEV